MAARPRTHKIDVENLYQKLDKRSGKVYYQYRDPRTGKFHGLGSDKKKAILASKELNRLIYEQLTEQYQHIINSNQVTIKTTGISTGKWCERYLSIQKERLTVGEIVESTFKSRRSAINVLIGRCKTTGIKELDTKTLATIIDEYKSEGKSRMSQVLRSVWIDLFKEAQHAGEVDAGYNPALATKPPRVEVKRERLKESDWPIIYESLLKNAPRYTTNAALLALTTGLRREDVCALKFRDIKDGFLYVATSKSKRKTKLAFPLELTNPLINRSLGEIISDCRQSGVVSKYVIHQTKRVYTVKPGDRVDVNRVTHHFAIARDLTGLKWKNKPSFHEIRSLAERSYRKVGIDTQVLLGHKDRRTTDRYDDMRGGEYTIIQIAK
ncbi:phage integrase Arm DNA-binding domain-containing protein [Vibrio salinus]|uniref:phage integrase Arm DNA-binding domain-containing protein n=1 Tax=Vibrio salinus TaxID=2899784 RepID=UPI001E3B5060|nr:phage integrase Arm DNA-binding domain-containing protein [Vibrio salinus]MCE0495737.1 phage integrase Arm DNA-binding domain-containing protein [Vibrio salinus]